MVEQPPRADTAHRRTVSLRVRITAVAVLMVGLALSAGSVVLVQQLHSHLVDSSGSTAESRADAVAALLATATDPDAAALASAGDDDDEFLQVVDGDGSVIAASENLAGRPAVQASDDDVVEISSDDAPFVVADSTVKTPQGRRTVIVGSSLDEARDASGSLARLLLVGVPAMVLIVGTTIWFLVGRALSPVERIRREAAEIGGSQLHRRLPEPSRHDEIGRLTETMNEMLTRLEDAQLLQRRFVSDAAHELRSPVASIRQNLEVATTYPDQISEEELRETVDVESARLEGLVSALLALARLDERTIEGSMVPVDLDDLVFAEADRLRRTTGLRIDTARVSAGRVPGDPALLGQALRNLVDNAERHARSTIALSLREHGSTVMLRIEDDGPGIPPEDRARIFERFVRLDEARTRDRGGAGLGLAIVGGIVAAGSGTVAATESDLGGAAFVITLPRSPDPD